MWIFGYGSLIWRPSFAFVERKKAFVVGWARRLWQGSPDHRGTPESPGRVATLVQSPGERCGGVAYRIDEERAPEILAELDVREKAGFDRVTLALHDEDGAVFAEGIVYVAKIDNPYFLGDADAEVIAGHVAKSHGPSGKNLEYVVRLHDALAELGIEDPHLAAILGRLPPST